KVCVDAIDNRETIIEVGGPETLTQKEIAKTAFDVLRVPPKITYVPEWVRVSVIKLVRIFTGSKVYGPIEFFMTVMAMNMIAPEYGKHTLREYFAEINKQQH
ncbi:MAG: SDR family NAD(P)-dependent oxidoreductase, partial [Desulfobulbia bacterium]